MALCNRNIYFRDNSVRFDEVLFIFPGKLQTLVHNYNIPSKNWDKRRHVFLLIGVMLTNSNKKYANNPLIKKLHFYMIHGIHLFVAVVCMKYTINVSVRQIIPCNQNISTYISEVLLLFSFFSFGEMNLSDRELLDNQLLLMQ